MNLRCYLNDGWRFTPEFTPAMTATEFDDTRMEEVRLPHTTHETPLNYFDEGIYQMVSGYRRVLHIPKAWEGKRVLVTFEAVGHDATVYLGGHELCQHHCGYTAFTVDLSEHLQYGGDNVLALRVDSRESLDVPPFGFVIDYMTYGGIYRDVYLDVKEPTYLKDVFLRGSVTDVAAGNVQLDTEVELPMGAQAVPGYRLRQSIREKGTEAYSLLTETPVTAGNITLHAAINGVGLWSVDSPSLYEVKTELFFGEELLDESVIAYGFRRAEFRKDGFYLNEKKVKLRGLNRHQSYPYVGYAMPASMQRLDADIMKHELGLNAARTSHYPQSHDFISRCDELGLLVFTEMPGWQHIGGDAWKAQAVENVREMVRQYRNHPSIVLWGVRINESVDDDAFYTRTNQAAHDLDPTRPTGGVRCIKDSHLLEDVYTYNDFVHEGDNPGCEPKRKVTSDVEKAYLISEYNGHMYPTKTFDCEEHRLQHALRHANVLGAVAGETDIAGSFGWCMFDYNTHRDFGSGDRICYHGVMDMFRNPKLAASVYASQQDSTPVLAVSSSMDIGEHPACNRGETYLFTNAQKVRMYKSGRLLKEYTGTDTDYPTLPHGPIPVDDYIGDALKAEHMKPKQEALVKDVLNVYAKTGMHHMPKKTKLKALWAMVRYRMTPGQALVLYNNYVGDWGGESAGYRFEALDEQGNVLKTVTKEAVTAISLAVDCDHTDLTEVHGYDVAALRIRAVDQNGNTLPYMNAPVCFTVSGPISLIGPELMSLQGGMGGTYIKTTGEAGEATLTVENGQMAPVTIRFTVTVPAQETAV